MHDHAAATSAAEVLRRGTLLTLFLLFITLSSSSVFAALLPRERGEFALALKAFDLKDYGDAAARFQRLSRHRVGVDLFHFNLGVSLMRLGRTEDAERELLETVRLRGELRYPATLYLADIYRQTKREGKARKVLSWLLARNDLPKELAAEAMRLSHDLETTEVDRDEYGELINLAVLRHKQGRWNEAFSYASGAVQRRRTTEAEFFLGLLLLEGGKPVEGKTLLKSVAERDERGDFADRARRLTEEYHPLEFNRLWLNGEYQLEMNNVTYMGLKQSNTSGVGTLRTGYHLLDMSEWRIDGEYQFQWQQLFGGAGTTLLIQQAGFRTLHDSGDWAFDVHLNGEFSSFTDQAFLLRSIFGWGIARRIDDARFALTVDAYQNMPMVEYYSYLRGLGGVGKFDFTYYGDPAMLSIYALYGVDLGGDSEIAPNDLVPLANLHSGAGEIVALPLSKHWFIRQGLSIMRKKYRRSGQPGDRIRWDIPWSAQLGFGYRSRSPYYFNLDLIYLVNKSNLDNNSVSDQSYREAILRGSLVWEFRP